MTSTDGGLSGNSRPGTSAWRGPASWGYDEPPERLHHLGAEVAGEQPACDRRCLRARAFGQRRPPGVGLAVSSRSRRAS